MGGIALALSGVVAAWTATHPATAGPPVPGMTIGVTHAQQSADGWGEPGAVSRARDVLASVAPVQNQHLMGWGALNPEPRPGDMEFASLDRRIEAITGTGAEPVLTLCCAPDWMKGGEPGTTDWDRLTTAPDPDHYDDFARLAAAAAIRYPEVRRFIVWNEFKGFYDEERNNWDVAAYTDLYNEVYRAVKEVRPDALVGGPYVVFDIWSSREEASHPSAVEGRWGVLDQRALDVVEYWLAHAEGADFVAVDASSGTRDDGLLTTDFEATEALGEVTRWVRSRTDLPVWWAELYATVDGERPSSDARRAAVMAQALVTVAQAGASGALLWQPEASEEVRTAALFTPTAEAAGGRPLPLVALLEVIGEELRRDPRRVETRWHPSGPMWTVRTPEWSAVWTPDGGVRGPFPTAVW
ncbi:hypothetical protein [Blastococcus xanthinilyticus]|uniref:hypothetical protein n=1 Tax=Blastococcus xanthinilyticus TaxID=1564164 RepID=UPI0014127D1C|nr:hypothetical protein [Blastococcus xanthinilyticus]